MPDATTKANEDHWNSSWRGRWPAAPHTMPTLRRSVLYSYDTSAPHPTPLHDRDGWAHHPAGHAGGHLGRDRLFSRLARRYPPSTPFFGGQLLPAPLPTRSSCPLTPHPFCVCSGGTVSSAVPYAEAYQHTSADVILFEIEDSVPALDKDRVRSHLVDVVGRGNFAPHQRRMVTVNRLDTPWGRDDLVAMAQAAVHGVVLAKCESPDEVRAASEILDAAPSVAGRIVLR